MNKDDTVFLKHMNPSQNSELIVVHFQRGLLRGEIGFRELTDEQWDFLEPLLPLRPSL